MEANDEAPPTTVMDAIEIAKCRYKEELVFADDINDHAATLAAAAGGPDKVLRYLGALAEMSATLSKAPLGKAIPIWLRDAGVEASGESETIKKSPAARAARTFRINGNDVYCDDVTP